MPVPSEDDVKQLSANTDPDEFLRDLGQMAGMMGMNGGSDEAAKLRADNVTDPLVGALVRELLPEPGSGTFTGAPEMQTGQ